MVTVIHMDKYLAGVSPAADSSLVEKSYKNNFVALVISKAKVKVAATHTGASQASGVNRKH